MTSALVHILTQFATGMPDGGPMYSETDLTRFPVEPWNTVSNFMLGAVIVYWIRWLRIQECRAWEPWLGIALLSVCFVGGTIYHASRSHVIWLALDGIPLVIFCMYAGAAFLVRTFHHKPAAVLLPIALTALALVAIPDSLSGATRGYISMASFIVAAALTHALITTRKQLFYLLLSIALFALAITAREIDFGANAFTVGTHFIWHVLGALSIHCLCQYWWAERYTKRAHEALT